MAYVFPPMNRNGNPKSYECDLVNLTRSVKNDPSTGFCKSLSGRISAFDFDHIKDDFCAVRDQKKPGAKLKSVDAFFQSKDGHFYFLEFKKTSREALDDIDDDGEKLPVEILFKRKAVDSLSVSALTVLQNVKGCKICDCAVLVVVFRQSVKDSFFAMEFNKGLTSQAGAEDSIKGKHPVMWGLNELKTLGFFKDVHTWPEDDFVAWAKDNLK